MYPQEANSKMSNSSRLFESISAPFLGCGMCIALWYQYTEMRAIRKENRAFRTEFERLCFLFDKENKENRAFRRKISRNIGNIGNSLGVLTESAIRLTQRKRYDDSYLQSCCLKSLSDVAMHCSRMILVKTTESGDRIEEEVQGTESEIHDLAKAMLTTVCARMVNYLEQLSIAVENDPDDAFVLNGCIASDVVQRLKRCARTMRKRACKSPGEEKIAALHVKAVESVSRYFSLLARSKEEADKFLIDGDGEGLGLMIYLSGISPRFRQLFQREVEMDCRGKILLEAIDDKAAITIECAEIKLGTAKGYEASGQLNLQLLLIHSALVISKPEAEFKLVGRIFFAKQVTGCKIISKPGPPALQIVPEDGVLSSKKFTRAELGPDDDSSQETDMPAEVTSLQAQIQCPLIFEQFQILTFTHVHLIEYRLIALMWVRETQLRLRLVCTLWTSRCWARPPAGSYNRDLVAQSCHLNELEAQFVPPH